LKNLLSKLEGNTKLEELMEEVLKNTEMRTALAGELGVEAPAPNATTNPEESK
jgi:predicted component of type VI protein secretion system